MRNNYLNFSGKLGAFICALSLASSGFAQAPVTQTFVHTGAVQQFTIPACVGSMTVLAIGARGADGLNGQAGALGGSVRGVITGTPGAVLYINVGGQGSVTTGGFNGGGNGGATANTSGGGGGGGSDIRIGSNVLASRIIVAGGGGGGGTNNFNATGGSGGGGNAFSSGTGFGGGGTNGCAVGQPGGEQGGGNGGYGSGGGGGGFLSGGSGGGQPSTGQGWQGCDGALGQGGNAGSPTANCGGPGGGINGPGGGGGGYYGGGGGMSGNGGCNGGGGGGSSWLNTTYFSSPSFTAGNSNGHGTVIVTYAFNGPGVTASASPTVICTGSSATLTAGSVVSQTWTPGSSNSTSIVVTPTINTTYTVQGTNNVGCISQQTVTVLVNNTPTVNATVSSNTICSGKTVTMTATGATTYSWTSGVVNGASYVPSATADYTATGTNACGSASAVVTVSVLTLPPIVASASSPSICSNNTVVVTATGGSSYNINPNVGINTTFTPLVTNNYTVTGFGANTCSATSVVNILVINTPTIAPVASPTAICVGQTLNISATGATGYTWTALNFAGSNASLVTVSPTVSTVYNLDRANGTCTSTAQLNVIVNTLPLLSLSPNSTVCACTGSVMLTAVNAITYTWLPSGSIGGNLVVYPCVTTNYTVGASNSFCTTYSTVLVTASPNPTIAIQSTTLSICAGSTVGLIATGAPNFTWTSAPTGGPYANSATLVDSPPVDRLYTATGSSTAGCISSAQKVVLVNQNPTVTIVSSNSFVCNGGTTTLSAFNASPTPAVTWSWSPTNLTAPSIVVSPTTSTNYTVTGTYTTGCKTTSIYPLTVYIATFAVNTPSAVCSGVSNTLVATAPAVLNYTWSTTPPQTSSIAVVSPTATTIYTVTAVNGLCQATRTVMVPVNPLPPVTITTPNWILCLFDEAVLTATGATSYTWGMGEQSNTVNFAATGNGGPNGGPSISTVFTVTGIDGNGCVKTTTATLFVSNCTGIAEKTGPASLFNVYPNPNNGHFTVKSEQPIELSVVNELGQTVKNISITETSNEVNVTDLANGIYYIMGRSENNIIATKIVVNK